MSEAAWERDYLTRAALAVDWKTAFDDAMRDHPDEFKIHFLADILGMIRTAAGVKVVRGGIFEDIFTLGLNVAEEDADLEDTIAELIELSFEALIEGEAEWTAAKKRYDFAADVLGIEFSFPPFEGYTDEMEDDEE